MVAAAAAAVVLQTAPLAGRVQDRLLVGYRAVSQSSHVQSTPVTTLVLAGVPCFAFTGGRPSL